MFKLCVFAACCASLVIYHFETLSNPHLETLGAGTFSIFSREYIQSPLIESSQSLGFAYVFTTSSRNAAALRAKFNPQLIDGESLTLDRAMSPHQILRTLGHSYQFSQDLPTLHTVYGYSGRGRDFITQGSTRVNLQIAVRGSTVTVGWPVILGSF